MLTYIWYESKLKSSKQTGLAMIKQVWEKLTIRTNEPGVVAGNLEKSDKVQNIQIEKDEVVYEQATWRQYDTEHLDRSDG